MLKLFRRAAVVFHKEWENNFPLCERKKSFLCHNKKTKKRDLNYMVAVPLRRDGEDVLFFVFILTSKSKVESYCWVGGALKSGQP